MQSLVSRRHGMIAANNLCAMQNKMPTYGPECFEENARYFLALAPNKYEFGE